MCFKIRRISFGLCLISHPSSYRIVWFICTEYPQCSSENYIIPENFYSGIAFCLCARFSHGHHFHLTAIVIDFPLSDWNYERTFPFCRKTQRIIDQTKWEREKCFRGMCVRRAYAMCAGAGAFMVRRKKLWLLLSCALSNHQHYWLSELHLMASVRLPLPLYVLRLSCYTMIFHSPPKPIFRSITYIHTSTFFHTKKKHSKHFGIWLKRVQTYLCFHSNLTFQFRRIGGIFISCVFFCALHCSPSSFLFLMLLFVFDFRWLVP